MKTIKNTQWSFYLGWILSGAIGFLITIPISLAFDVFVFNQILGEMMMVRGAMVITEDYMLMYAYIPWYGLVIGTFQYLLLRQKLTKMGWWILVTSLGWSLVWLGIALRTNPLGDIEIPSSAGYFLIAGTSVGVLIGVIQWLILRMQVAYASWWIPINGLGFGIAGIILANISSWLEYMIVFTIPCISTGILLWLLLEKFPQDVNHRHSPIIL